MRQIIYSSRATHPLTMAGLEEILADARDGNERRGVTGVLIFASGVFVQILEGEDDVLEELLASIRGDRRHGSMKVFHDAKVKERAFGDWRMAYLPASAQDMSRWAGLEGGESIDALLDDLHQAPDRVPRILISIVKAIAAQSPGD